MKVLLGVTGSVAATLTPKMAQALVDEKHEVRILATKHSLHFWDPKEIKDCKIFQDADEWPEKYVRGSPVLHIDLRNWADLLVIAPLSANTLAKLAAGMADNLLTSVVRAWNRQKLVVMAPAMNTFMWNHPATQEHLKKIYSWNYFLEVVNPISKTLACGEDGIGAMAPVEEIIKAIQSHPGGKI